MQFKFRIATKVFFGEGCLNKNKSEIAGFGKKCMIVTGRSSGKKSGALDDMTKALEELSIDYIIYDKIENNPSLENVADAGKIAREEKVDFIAGIGGGSPLDASKAVAVLAVNDIQPVELFNNAFDNRPLPIIAIPTTAGTGSEVTPYSILTRNDIKNKMSFGNDDIFPAVAFLDARYTESLPYSVTVDTAIDALSHAVEGYTNKRSTIMSDIFAVEAISVFGECLDNLLTNKIDYRIREKLLYMAMLGGMVISHTGTTIVHGLGYPLTYYKGIPHGRANGMLMAEYLKFNYEAIKDKADNILRLLRVGSLDEFGKIMKKLVNTELSLSEDEITLFASTGAKHRSVAQNPRDIAVSDMVSILKNVFKVW